jgi:predicted DCC family thiol-disulfide oxidoreductase YuxK
MPNLPPDLPQPLVLFDGVCNLCSGWVQFVLVHERERRLHFAAMQSATGQRVLRDLGLPLDVYESFLFIEEGGVHSKSEGFLRMLRHLRRPWPWLRLARILPRALADWAYDRIARNRYRLFGRRDTCMVPRADLAERFLA